MQRRQQQIPKGNDREKGKSGRGVYATGLLVMGLVLMGGAGLRSQVDAGSGAFRTDSGGVMDKAAFRERAGRLNVERQKRMASDSERLVVLAASLKAEVDAGKAGDSTSGRAGLVHEADEIAKLAHGVKARMSDGIPRGSH